MLGTCLGRADHEKSLPTLAVAGDAATEAVTLAFAGESEQELAVFAGVDVSVADSLTGRSARHGWRANNNIGVAIPIHIPGAIDVLAKRFARVSETNFRSTLPSFPE